MSRQIVDAPAVLRRLARDQWVRLHGTPRVTVLAGGEVACALWFAWMGVTGGEGSLLHGDEVEVLVKRAVERAVAEPGAPIAIVATLEAITRWRESRHDRLAAMVDEGLVIITEANQATTAPDPSTTALDPATTAPRSATRPRVASVTTRAQPASPAGGGVAPGSTGELSTQVVEVAPDPAPAFHIDARSAAEAAMYEALQATPATAGRFTLNESLSVRFGSRAAEVDLLSRADRIAIEIDGIHHFADPDCYRRDRRKDLLLQTRGLLVIRLLAEDVLRDPRDAVRLVCEGLAYRRAEELRG